ncbi:unnamed protein product [Paramecium pentaurelia]|uniref:Uncharacterized protein n=1 Tax=Paramecium pentaurelia TaxID=43138 RepID=A0A8S1SPY8_9CILI|nr:unnamed protein product [Paramecium pentaurelia]
MENLAVAQTYFPPQTTFVSIYDQQISSPFQKSLLVQDSKTKEDFILLGTVKSQNCYIKYFESNIIGLCLHLVTQSYLMQILFQSIEVFGHNLTQFPSDTILYPVTHYEQVDSVHYSLKCKAKTIQNYQIQIQINNLYVKFPLIEKVKPPYSTQRLVLATTQYCVRCIINIKVIPNILCSIIVY